jgi:hypothetical protein
LSEADQRYIAGLAAQNPFGNNANPAAPAAQKPTTTVSRSMPDFVSFAELEVQAVDIFQTREAGGIVPQDWSDEADPAPLPKETAAVTRLVFRSQGMLQAPRYVDFFVDSAGNKAVVACQSLTPAGGRGTEKSFTRISLGDTATGQTIAQDTPLKLRPFGFSPNGKHCIFHQDDWGFPGYGKRTLLHITEVTPAGWVAAATFEPFAQLKRAAGPAINIPASSNPAATRALTEHNERLSPDADVHWAAWADDEHVLIQAVGGTVILLNIGTGKAVWRTSVDKMGDIALSPGRKYCVLPVGTRAVLYETMTGKVVGGIDRAQSQKIRFSPDGKRFASCNAQGIILGDATTGTADTPFFVSDNSKLQQLFLWLDNRFLLFGNDVVDTASKTVVWNYAGLQDNTGIQNNVKLIDGYCWCMFNRSGDSYLVPLTIPHAKMMSQAFLADGTVDLALTKGSEVSLVLESSIGEDKQEEIRKSIEKKITANGWVIADNAPVSIVLKIEEEKADKAEYTTSRGPFPPIPRPVPSILRSGGTEIEFKPERYRLLIMQGETELWSAFFLTKPPQWVKLDEIKDSSLQGVVDKAMEDQSYPKWLDGLLIPRTFAKKHAEGKGTSRVTENGIEEVATKK